MFVRPRNVRVGEPVERVINQAFQNLVYDTGIRFPEPNECKVGQMVRRRAERAMAGAPPSASGSAAVLG